MHGIIFFELQKYVDSKVGGDAWKKMLKEAGLGNKTYLNTQEYPDSEVGSLVTAASRMTGKPAETILEDFGEFIVPDLVSIYRGLLKPEWKTLDLIENAELVIHTTVRRKNPEAKPPELKCERVSPNEVIIHYNSARKMCSVGKGISKGVARHFHERVLVSESSCMLKGDLGCKISVKLLS